MEETRLKYTRRLFPPCQKIGILLSVLSQDPKNADLHRDFKILAEEFLHQRRIDGGPMTPSEQNEIIQRFLAFVRILASD